MQLGYNDFNFFDKIEPPRPKIDVKWTHKIRFSFLEPFRPNLALKLAKIAIISKRIFFHQKFDMGSIKRKF